MPNDGSSPTRRACSRSSRAPTAWKVPAQGRRTGCGAWRPRGAAALAPRRPGAPRAAIISCAARRLKVSRRIRAGSTPLTTSQATRCARVAVLPVPAPAMTSSGGAAGIGRRSTSPRCPAPHFAAEGDRAALRVIERSEPIRRRGLHRQGRRGQMSGRDDAPGPAGASRRLRHVRHRSASAKSSRNTVYPYWSLSAASPRGTRRRRPPHRTRYCG